MVKEEIAKGLEYIYHAGETIAIIMRKYFESDRTIFFTPNSFSQQLGYLYHRRGSVIKAHIHRLHSRNIVQTQEFLLIKKGKVKVNLYSRDKKHIASEILEAGDIVLLCGGGHGFEIIEDTVMIEVKQGPFVPEEDKDRFEGVEEGVKYE